MLEDVANWAQIIGSISLPLALYGLYSAKRDLAHERRLSHELEVLRELAEIPGYEYFRRYAQIRTLVLLIHGDEDMPMTRAALFATASDKALARYKTEYPDAPRGRDRLDTRLEYIRFDTMHSEMLEAIERRVAPVRPRHRRLWSAARSRAGAPLRAWRRWWVSQRGSGVDS